MWDDEAETIVTYPLGLNDLPGGEYRSKLKPIAHYWLRQIERLKPTGLRLDSFFSFSLLSLTI